MTMQSAELSATIPSHSYFNLHNNLLAGLENMYAREQQIERTTLLNPRASASFNPAKQVDHYHYQNQQYSTHDASQDTSRIPDLPQRDIDEAGSLGKHFFVRNRDYKTFFKLGKVFSLLWSEPLGRRPTSRDDFDHSVSEIVFRERVHSTIRQFVVVRDNDMNCTCLPIATYAPQNTKKNIKLRDHGIIYEGSPPSQLQGFSAKPIKVQLVGGLPALRNYTIVNYTKPYTIEKNVKVRELGDIILESVVLLLKNFCDTFTLGNELQLQMQIYSDTSPQTMSYPHRVSHIGNAGSGSSEMCDTGSPSTAETSLRRIIPLPNYRTDSPLPQNILSQQTLLDNSQSGPQAYREIMVKFLSGAAVAAAFAHTMVKSEQFANEPTSISLEPQASSSNPFPLPKFVVIGKPTRFFKLGRVFKTLWSEPAGGTAKDLDPTSKFYTQVQSDEYVFSKVRRFVVIRERIHNCLCLPLYTYGGQGTTKSDVRAEDHAIVYALGEKPQAPLDEERLDKEPVELVVENGEKLDPTTRVNFAQIYTIQHNVKVAKVGRISKDHVSRLNSHFIQCVTKF